MSRYAFTGLQDTNTTTFKTIMELLGAATVRWNLYDILMGASGTPADNALVYELIRLTATGTGTTVTGEPLDPGDPTALVLGEENATIEPTLAGIALIELPVNLRASYRWVAAPGSEIVVAAVAGEGLMFRSKSAAYTGQTEATLFEEE